ncbi:MAG: ABC transporter permease [Albidovulum sp.]|nr:ABC transporter permease [Albidovulum sp.]MDE0303651.1 ABC transporter permease [Albidovulum sp.]MDE0533156.1 ABC transporter permease [Albidovulum sp.]
MRRLRLLDFSLASVTAFVYLSLYLPILLVFVLSFFSMRRGRVNWETFSLGWYAKLFKNEALGDALLNSLLVGIAAVLVAMVFATLAAINANSRPSSRSAQFLEYVIFLPFLLPPIITGLSLLIYFREAGIPRGLPTIIVGHAVFVLAIIYRILLTRLNALSRSLVDAAHDLGASNLQTFRYIILPNLRMPLLTSGILAFALSFDETMITLFLTGTDATLPVRLYAMIRVGFTPEINALIALILGFSIILTVALAYAWGRNSGSGGNLIAKTSK